MNRQKSLGKSTRTPAPTAKLGRLARTAAVGATLLGSLAVACSSAAVPPPQAVHPPTRVEGSAAADATELASKGHMAAFAEQLETTLHEPNDEHLAALVPIDFAGMSDPNAATYLGKLVREASIKEGEDLHIVRVVHDGPDPRVVTRKDTTDGRHVFLGWMVTYDVNGRPHLSDLCNYSRGVSASSSLRDAGSLLDRPLPKGMSQRAREQMLKVFEPGNDPQEVLNTYAALPPEYKADRFIQLQWVPAAAALANIDDPHAAVAADALSKWAHQDREIPAVDAVIAFNDAGDTERAFREFRAVEREVGTDPILDLLHADVALSVGRLDEARAFANRARQAVPDYEDAYWTLVATAVEGRHFNDAVRHLRTLRDGLNVETVYFEGEGAQLLGPHYSDLLESTQYKTFAQEGLRASEKATLEGEPQS